MSHAQSLSGDGKTTSEEVDERQLELASQAGDAYLQAVEYIADEVAHTGETERADDYVVGFAQEEAEGMYALEDGEFTWRNPEAENCHLEVAVADADDGRFVPHLDVTATLTGEDGERVGPFEVPFLWHPGVYHYGRNVELPDEGQYTIEIHVEPPEFERHDRQNGDRYGKPVEVTFDDVHVQTGQD